MAKCKTCGTEAASPKKKWVMTGRSDKTGKKTQLEIGLFDCANSFFGLPTLIPTSGILSFVLYSA